VALGVFLLEFLDLFLLFDPLDAATHRLWHGHDLAAEAVAVDLDPPCELDLLVAGQQRDLAHLRQVHPHRIIDLVVEFFNGGGFGCVGGRFVLRAARRALALFGGPLGQILDQFEALRFELAENLLELLGVVGRIGQQGVELVVGDHALAFGLLDQRRHDVSKGDRLRFGVRFLVDHVLLHHGLPWVGKGAPAICRTVRC